MQQSLMVSTMGVDVRWVQAGKIAGKIAANCSTFFEFNDGFTNWGNVHLVFCIIASS